MACHGSPTPDAYTGFELGSITKTFTALLLADMAARGEVGYQDPISAYLPPEATPHRMPDQPITLLHLATHTGGLPRLPTNFYPQAVRSWRTNPYAHYSLNHLYRASARIRPRHRPGARVRYSNFGVGLLGQLLANAAGRDYQDLVIDRVCRPLGMTNTRVVPDATYATGHRRGRPVPPWEMGALAAAGVLRSNATHLLGYLHAQLHPQTTPLDAALRAVQQPRVPAKGKDRICLAWNYRAFRDYDLFFHSGATRGFTAFVGFSPQAKTGVAALANATPTRHHSVIPTACSLLKTLTKQRP